ncbi:MAG TPA: DUF1918 domain-containing protein [Mycobacteriales bacterium]|nr:DUF1918 domain-containing protein [Mycobacteriales bacterium]
MQAHVGDELVVEGNTVGRRARHGTILEVRSPEGQPPYWVHWDDGHDGLTYPGPDAHVVDVSRRNR